MVLLTKIYFLDFNDYHQGDLIQTDYFLILHMYILLLVNVFQILTFMWYVFLNKYIISDGLCNNKKNDYVIFDY